MTSETDPREPGGSGAGSTVVVELERRLGKAAAMGRHTIVGIDQSDMRRIIDQLRADLETVQKQLADEHEVGTVEHARQHLTCGQIIAEQEIALAQSRATEAELRAEKKELLNALGIYGEHLSTCWIRQTPQVEVIGRSKCNCGYFAAVGTALDAAEQPARAEGEG